MTVRSRDRVAVSRTAMRYARSCASHVVKCPALQERKRCRRNRFLIENPHQVVVNTRLRIWLNVPQYGTQAGREGVLTNTEEAAMESMDSGAYPIGLYLSHRNNTVS